MADQLFSRFPMLDAAIVNAVAESFASASGQVDVVEATRALETMLPNEYKSQSHVVQQLPDSICVVDPMHSFTGISPSNSSEAGDRRNGINAVGDNEHCRKEINEIGFLLDIFRSLDPALIKSAYEKADHDADAAFTILQNMADRHSAEANLDSNKRHNGRTSPQQRPFASTGDVPPRDFLVQRFPTIPAAQIERVLTDNHHDIDASIAHLMSEAGTAGGNGATAAEWFEQHQRDEAFISTLPEDEFKRKLSSLRMFFMSGASRRGGVRVLPAERIAAALHYCNCNFEAAKSLLLATGADDLPPYELPAEALEVEPDVRHLQARLEEPADPGTLADILKSVDGNMDSAVALLRESGARVKPDIPVAPLAEVPHVGNVRRATAVYGSPRKRKAARGAMATVSPALPQAPTLPLARGHLRSAAVPRPNPSVASPGGAVCCGDADTRDLANHETVWCWIAEGSTWVEAAVVCHNPGQLAVEYTVRLLTGGLVDARRANLRPRYTSKPPPAPLEPLQGCNAAAPIAAAETGRDSSSPILVEHFRGPDRGGAAALPRPETVEFRDIHEDSALCVARELQEAQDRTYALQLASELPPEAAALPESDDDDNIGLLKGEAQARATQTLYERLNQPVKEMIEQIKDKKAAQEEERAAGNFHNVGQMTYEIQAMEKKREEMQAEVAARMYRARNRHNREVFTLDLHGLHVPAALQRLSDKLVHAAGNPSPGRTLLVVITGYGKHSAVKNHSKLRHEVGTFLNRADTRQRFNLATAMGKGHFVVELFPAGEAPAPLSHSEFVELSNWPSVRPALSDAGAAPEQNGARGASHQQLAAPRKARRKRGRGRTVAELDEQPSPAGRKLRRRT